MDTDVNSIMIAMEGKIEMMYPEAVQKRREEQVSVTDKWKQAVKAHNARYKRE